MPVRADVRTEARKSFRAGMKLLQEEDYRAGVEKLETAYELLPHPAVLYNIAKAYADWGRLDEAIERFEAYLAGNPRDRHKTRATLAQLRFERDAQLARLAAEAAASQRPEEESVDLPRVTTRQLDELDESAKQMAALAVLTQSEVLRTRAESLQRLSKALRRNVHESGPEVKSVEEPAPPRPEENLPAAAPRPIIAKLESDEEAYEERIVSASRFSQSPLDAPNSTTIVTAQDIRLSGITNIADLLRRVAGVEVMTLTPGDTEVSIRGLNQRLSNKVLVLIDGRSVFLDFIGTTLWHSLPVGVEDIERIEIIRGPASAIYGADAFSGIINLVLREPGEGRSGLHVRGGEGATARAHVSLTGHAESGLDWRFSAGYDQAAQYTLLLDPARQDVRSFADNPDIGVRQARFNASLRAPLGKGWTLRSGAGVSAGTLSFFGVSRLRELVARDSVFGQANVSLSSPWGLDLRAYWNTYRTDVGSTTFDPAAIPVISNDLVSHMADVELVYARRFELFVEHNFAVGAGYRFKYIDMDWLGPVDPEHHFSLFVEDAMKIHPMLRLLLSARMDRHPLLQSLQLSPRVAVVVRPTSSSAIRATWGTAFRSPTFLESYLAFENATPFRGVTALGLGNPNLTPEKMVSYEIGFTQNFEDTFVADASFYYNLVNDQILLSSITPYTLSDYPDYSDEVDAYPVGQIQFENEDHTFRQLGAELGVRFFPLRGLDVYLNYAIHDTSPVDPTVDLDGREDEKRTSAHKINGGVQLRGDAGLDAAIDLHWVSEQRWVEQVTDEVTGVRFESFDLVPYFLINARLGYRLLGDRLQLGLVGLNLLDQRRRQHPFGQRISRRVLATAEFTF